MRYVIGRLAEYRHHRYCVDHFSVVLLFIEHIGILGWMVSSVMK